MKKILLTICVIALPITGVIAQNVPVNDAQNLIIGTWYRDFSTYSEPQNIVPIDTSFKIVYDQNYIYYYKNNVLVDQCGYDIRSTDCKGRTYMEDRSFLVEPSAITNEEVCSLILNITTDVLVLTNNSTGKIYKYVKTP